MPGFISIYQTDSGIQLDQLNRGMAGLMMFPKFGEVPEDHFANWYCLAVYRLVSSALLTAPIKIAVNGFRSE